MVPCPVTAAEDDPIRDVGLAMGREGVDLVAVLDDDGTLAGVLSENALARRYIRESRDASDFASRPVRLEAVCDVLDAEILVTGDGDVSGRLWVLAMEAEALREIVGEGDIAVVGDLPASQKAAIELGVDLLVLSNGTRPGEDVLAAAREAHVNLVVSPLDSYVSARMIQLAVPVGRVMDVEPLTVEPDDVLEDVTPEILEVDYRAAVVVDSRAAAARARDPLGARRARAAQGDPGRPRRGVPERAGDRAGGDRRDPRPPPHRLDRDARPGARDVRPGRARRRRSCSSGSRPRGSSPGGPPPRCCSPPCSRTPWC